MASKVKVFTVTDQPNHPGALRLQRSAAFWGWDLTVKLVPSSWWERDTYRAEQKGLLEALLEPGLPEWMMYVDAWDTLFTGPPQELPLEKGKLAFCGDLHCFPNEVWKGAFPQVGFGEFPYLNAGVFWGDPRVAIELCDEYLALDNQLCNQDFFNLRYLYELGTGRSRLAVDSRAQVALNMWGMHPAYSHLTRVNRRLYYKPTGTTPLVVHAAGSSMFHDVPPMPAQALHE